LRWICISIGHKHGHGETNRRASQQEAYKKKFALIAFGYSGIFCKLLDNQAC